MIDPPRREGAALEPWQLAMFDRSLKKRQKLELLLELLGPIDDERCLLLTAGDNTGALNHHFRAGGGRWTWGELADEGIRDMARFLGEPVHRVQPDSLPFRSDCFDRVVVIDVHEHLADVDPFNRELARVLAPGARIVITTPNGDRRLPVARLKRWIGMDESAYGHEVQGYETEDLKGMLSGVGLSPDDEGAYSRFFTEVVELAINFCYVKLLARRGDGRDAPGGVIAPNSEERFRAVKKSYRAYSLAYPFLRAFSLLDALIPGTGGYAVAVTACKAD